MTYRRWALYLFLLQFSLSPGAMALGVEANTLVTSAARANYKYFTINQGTRFGNHDFRIDQKVDLNVARTDTQAVSAGHNSSGNVLTFSVTNTGNGVVDFSLTAVALNGGAAAFGGVDAANASATMVRVESGATPGYQAGEDVASYIDELAPDASRTVYIVSSFDASAANGDIASYYLVAVAQAGGSNGVLGASLTSNGVGDVFSAMDIGFYDADADSGSVDAIKNAAYLAQSDYTVLISFLTFTKQGIIISDPFNGTTNPQPVAGAIMEYVATVSNSTGTTPATNIVFTTNLATQITNQQLLFNSQYNGVVGKGIAVAYPGNGNVSTVYTNANDGVEDGQLSVDWNVSQPNTVTVKGLNLNVGESAVIRFRVTIK